MAAQASSSGLVTIASLAAGRLMTLAVAVCSWNHRARSRSVAAMKATTLPSPAWSLPFLVVVLEPCGRAGLVR